MSALVFILLHIRRMHRFSTIVIILWHRDYSCDIVITRVTPWLLMRHRDYSCEIVISRSTLWYSCDMLTDSQIEDHNEQLVLVRFYCLFWMGGGHSSINLRVHKFVSFPSTSFIPPYINDSIVLARWWNVRVFWGYSLSRATLKWSLKMLSFWGKNVRIRASL